MNPAVLVIAGIVAGLAIAKAIGAARETIDASMAGLELGEDPETLWCGFEWGADGHSCTLEDGHASWHRCDDGNMADDSGRDRGRSHLHLAPQTPGEPWGLMIPGKRDPREDRVTGWRKADYRPGGREYAPRKVKSAGPIPNETETRYAPPADNESWLNVDFRPPPTGSDLYPTRPAPGNGTCRTCYGHGMHFAYCPAL